MRLKNILRSFFILSALFVGNKLFSQSFAPTNLPNLTLWLKADSGVTVNIDSVSRWADVSGNGNDAVQTTSGLKPRLVNSTELCGKPALRFDGLNDSLGGTVIPNIGSSSISLFIVAKPAVITGNRPLFSIGKTTGMYLWHVGANLQFRNNGQVVFSGNINPQYYLFTVRKNFGVNDSVFTNSIITGLGNINTAGAFADSIYNYSIGKIATQTPNFLGDIAEIILYKSALVSTDRAKVEKYLFDKYAPKPNLGADTTINFGFCPISLATPNACYTNYRWNTGATTASISVNRTGNYWVRTTDIFGRQSYDTIKVTYPNTSINKPDTTICAGDTIFIAPKLSSFNNYSFIWNTGETTASIRISTPGDYYVTVSDGNCLAYSDTITVTNDLFKNSVSLGSDTSICAGNRIGIKTPLFGWNVLQFLWSTGSSDSTTVISLPGQYQVTVSNSRGCVAYDSIAVAITGTAPIINFLGDTLCLGETYFTSNITSTADTPLVYNWNFGNGNFSGVANPNFVYSAVGQYMVSLFATTTSGCSSNASRSVLIKPNPAAYFQTTTACINNSYQFYDLSTSPFGDSINLWNWDFGDTTSQSFAQNPSHLYLHPNNHQITLIVSASNGCTDTLQNILTVVATYTPPDNPLLQLPTNNYQSGNQNINFSWSPSKNAVKYSLLISSDSTFTTAIAFNNIISSVYLATVPINPVYFWKIKAYNICNGTSESEIRKFTMFVPSDLPNLTLWLRADNGTVQNGGAVSQWNDQSTNGFNAVQTTSNAQPIIVYPSELCGKPALAFDGIRSVLQGPTITGLGSSSMSLFVIAKPNVVSGNRSIFSVGDDHGLFLWQAVTSLQFRNNASTVYFGGVSTTQYCLMEVKKKLGVSDTVYRNALVSGYSSVAAATSIVPDDNYCLGKASFSQFFNGEIAEVILYDTALNTSARQQVENYLFNKYSGPVNLGPDINVAMGFCPRQLNATNCYKTYLWSTNETTPTINVNQSGIYSVTVTDIFGRLSSDTVMVKFPNINLTIADTTICLGDSIHIQTQLPSPQGYKFHWNTGDSSTSIQVATTGNYSVEVSYAGCSSFSDTRIVSIDTFQDIVSLGADTSMCTGNLIGIETPAIGWGSLQFQWSTGETNAYKIVPDSGTFSVTVTNALGCQGSDSIHVTKIGSAPIVTFSGDTICFGQNYTPQNNSFSTDTSVITGYIWEFGDGGIATASSPNYFYSTGGSYQVTLSATTSAGCLNYVTNSILVKPIPVAAFQPGTSCINTPYQFLDISSAPSGDSISQWDWNFGDGSVHSFLSNPSHLYTSANAYPITFIATASNGCTDTITDSLVVVQNAPNPQVVNLQSPVNNFQAVSSTVTLSWATTANVSHYSLWISTNSSFSSPVVVNNIIGTQYTITIAGGTTFYWKVRGYNVCDIYSESQVRVFIVFKPTDLSNLALWLAADSGVTQSGGFVSVWKDQSGNVFNANQPNSANQPSIVNPFELVKPALSFDGNNDVLGGSLIPGIGSSSISLFVIAKPNVITGNRSIFSVDEEQNGMFLWQTGNAFQFRNNSKIAYGPPGNAQYYLLTAKKKVGAFDSLFRNSLAVGGNLSAAAGAVVPDSNYVLGKLPTSSFFKGEIAEVIVYKSNLNTAERLEVENYLYNKYSPPVDLGPDKNQTYSLCPLEVEAGVRFRQFLWSTGDTTHSIEAPRSGIYWVRATDVFDRVSSDTIQITLPYAGMNTPDTAVCIGSSINIAPILPEGSPYNFLWNDSLHVSPFYNTDSVGNYFCSITDTSGCVFISDSVRISVDSFALISLLPVDTGMCSGNNLAIETGIYHPRNQLWSTGDTTVQITISTNGIFSVDVTDINSCNVRDSVAVTIKGIAPTAYFTASRACFGDSVHFLDSSVTIQPDVVSFWNWSFGDNEGSVLKNPSHSYPITGDFVATLYIKTDSGCTGSYSAPIKVFAKPEAKYSYPGIICAGNSSQFFDNSIVLPTDTIIQWKWWFNQTDSFNSKSVAYSFPAQGDIPVIFRVTTTNGCSDAISSFIEVFPSLDANFNFSQTCLGDSTKFVDITPSLSIVRWQWNYGDGSFFASVQNPVHRYLVPGAYNVSLAVENAIGCLDTISKNVLVVEQPIADFTNLSHCIDLSYTPKDSSSSPSEPIHRWDWNIGGTFFNNNHYPQSYFADTGNYTVKLLVTTNSGCRDSVSKIVQVHPNPVSLFAMAPLYGEAPLNVTFNNHSTNATSYIWNFGDGSAVSPAENTAHTYSQNDTFHIVLTATSDFGCSNTSSQTFYVTHTDLDLSVDAVESVSQVQNDGSVLINVKALMSNVGTRTITHIHAYATLGTGGVIAEDWTGLLQSGQIMEDTFHARFVVAASNANSYVCVDAVEVNYGETELRTDNNRQCESLTGTMQLVGPSPNPAFNQSTLGIVLPKAGNVSIAIVDALGHYVMPEAELDFPVGRSDFEIPTGLMLAAEYFIRVTYNEEKTVRKFILQK